MDAKWFTLKNNQTIFLSWKRNNRIVKEMNNEEYNPIYNSSTSTFVINESYFDQKKEKVIDNTFYIFHNKRVILRRYILFCVSVFLIILFMLNIYIPLLNILLYPAFDYFGSNGLTNTSLRHMDIVITFINESSPRVKKDMDIVFEEGRVNFSARNYLDICWTLERYSKITFARVILVLSKLDDFPKCSFPLPKNVVSYNYQDLHPDYQGLSTYNSRAIEMAIHYIPMLTEYFVYANDDEIPGARINTLRDAEFLDSDGRINFYRSFIYEEKKIEYNKVLVNTYKKLRKIGVDARLFNKCHFPQIFKKSILFEMEFKLQEEFQYTRKTKRRTSDDFDVMYMAYGMYVEKLYGRIFNVDKCHLRHGDYFSLDSKCSFNSSTMFFVINDSMNPNFEECNLKEFFENYTIARNSFLQNQN